MKRDIPREDGPFLPPHSGQCPPPLRIQGVWAPGLDIPRGRLKSGHQRCGQAVPTQGPTKVLHPGYPTPLPACREDAVGGPRAYPFHREQLQAVREVEVHLGRRTGLRRTPGRRRIGQWRLVYLRRNHALAGLRKDQSMAMSLHPPFGQDPHARHRFRILESSTRRPVTQRSCGLSRRQAQAHPTGRIQGIHLDRTGGSFSLPIRTRPSIQRCQQLRRANGQRGIRQARPPSLDSSPNQQGQGEPGQPSPLGAGRNPRLAPGQLSRTA